MFVVILAFGHDALKNRVYANHKKLGALRRKRHKNLNATEFCQIIRTYHFKNVKGNYIRIKISKICHVISKITDNENEAKK